MNPVILQYQSPHQILSACQYFLICSFFNRRTVGRFQVVQLLLQLFGKELEVIVEFKGEETHRSILYFLLVSSSRELSIVLIARGSY